MSLEELVSGIAKDEKLLGSLVGAVAFPSLLGVFQRAFFKPLGLSCNVRFSSLFGFASVSLASYGASWAALRVFYFMKNKRIDFQSLGSFAEPELMLATVGGALVFRTLGGKFRNVLPSHLLYPGAFAQVCFPASLSSYATIGVKNSLKKLGRKYGCHSCGRKRVAEFFADHQPPSAVMKHVKSGNGGEVHLGQQFHPQCSTCSLRQSIACTRYLKGLRDLKALVTHSSSLRIYHVFLPIPVALVYGKELVSDLTMQRDATTNTELSSGVLATSTTTTSQPAWTAGEAGATGDSATPPVGVKKAESAGWQEGDKEEKVVDSVTSDFPLLIVWQYVVQFLDSLPSPLAAFHLTLWTFTIIAAWGTI